MKILKLSHGSAYFNDESYREMLFANLACMHQETPAKGTSSTSQFQLFIEAKLGDIVFICNSNTSIDVIGFFVDSRPLHSPLKSHDNKWIAREYFPLFTAKNSKSHKKDIGKWWSPGDNSTCNEVKESDYDLFESSLLMPAFEVSMEVLLKKRQDEVARRSFSIKEFRTFQASFEKCFNTDQIMLNAINNLDLIEKRKLLYEYESRGDINTQPVVLLRKNLIKYSVSKNGTPLKKTIVLDQKKEISKKFTKNVFHSWTSLSRVLYPFIYASTKELIRAFFLNEIKKFQEDLQLETCTKFNFVDFDGAQNQGRTDIWFAIYNNSHKSQKYAKQLFLKIGANAEYGLLSHQTPALNKLTKAETYNYEVVKNNFMIFKQQILEDDANHKKQLIEMIDLLEFKKQVVFQGPPGTGKTKKAKELAAEMLGLFSVDELFESKYFKLIQFHPSYSYEDFVRGIEAKPADDGKGIIYRTVNRILGEFAKTAQQDSTGKYILVIDEINRANLSSVFGELIYALEYRGDGLDSMYEIVGERGLVLPPNLFIIGTMNTADRSVGHIDYAMRRRFAFIDVLPENLKSDHEIFFHSELFETVSKLFISNYDSYILNKSVQLIRSKYLSPEFEPKDVWLGHSYFFQKIINGDEEMEPQDFNLRIKYEIVPILREYVKDGVLSEHALEEINKIEVLFE